MPLLTMFKKPKHGRPQITQAVLQGIVEEINRNYRKKKQLEDNIKDCASQRAVEDK